MKIKHIPLLMLFPLFISCVGEQDDIFGKTPITRLDDALQQYSTLLSSAENGWILEYYPEADKYGGFNLYLNFTEEGEVTITAETAILRQAGETATSLYSLKADMAPVLSFDTYNRILHQFSDPAPDGLGYEGDYEFIILGADDDQIELKGKKRNNKMTMTKLPSSLTWTEFCSDVDTMVKHHPGFNMELQLGQTIIPLTESGEVGRYLTFELEEDIAASAKGVAYTYTPTGIKFKEPITIDGQTVQHFVASQDGKLICQDEAPGVQINSIPLNQAFVKSKANWFFDGDRIGPMFTTLWKRVVNDLDKNSNEELIYLYLRSPAQTLSLISYSREDEQAYPAGFYLDFVPVEGEDNQLQLINAGGGDQMAMLFYYTYFRTLILYTTGEIPYTLIYNNLKIPHEITFARTENPETDWFVLTK